MLSHRLLVSTCAFALIATPALPQAAQGQAPSQARAQPNAALSTPPSMRAALRAFGLDRQTRTTRFTKGQVTDERAQFSALSVIGADGKTTTLDNLVLTRNSTPGASFGTFNVEGDKFSEADGSGFGRFTITGLRGGGGLIDALAQSRVTQAGTNRRAAGRNDAQLFAETVVFTDLLSNLNQEKALTTARVETVTFSGLSFGPQSMAFEALELKNSTFDNASSATKVGVMRVNGISSDLFEAIANQGDGAMKTLELAKVALGGAAIENMTISFKSTNNTPAPLDTMSIGRFGFDNIRDGFIGQFLVSDIKMGGGVGAKAWEFGLEKFGLTGINMRYFGEIGAALEKYIPKPVPEPTAGATSAAPATPPPPPALVATTPRTPILLKDLLRGGPMDGGIRGIEMAAFKVSVAGFDFTIDKVGLSQQRNSDDIIVRSDMIPTIMRLTLPASATQGENPFSQLVSGLGIDQMAIRVSGNATYVPASDVLSVSNYQFEVIDWGKVRMDFAMSGIAKLYATTTFDDLVKASIPPKTKPNADTGPRAAPATEAQMRALFTLYKDIGFNSARMEVVDTGGIEKTVKAYLSTRRPNAGSVSVSAQQVTDERNRLAQTARSEAGKKSLPPILRQIALAGGRWMESGGSIIVQANPQRPIMGIDFVGSDVPPLESWGLQVSSNTPPRPPTASNRQAPPPPAPPRRPR